MLKKYRGQLTTEQCAQLAPLLIGALWEPATYHDREYGGTLMMVLCGTNGFARAHAVVGPLVTELGRFFAFVHRRGVRMVEILPHYATLHAYPAAHCLGSSEAAGVDGVHGSDRTALRVLRKFARLRSRSSLPLAIA